MSRGGTTKARNRATAVTPTTAVRTPAKVLTFVMAVALCASAGCAALEKRVDLTYGPTANVRGGPGEIFLAKPVIDVRFQRMPGSVVMGSVRNTGALILTGDDVSGWVMGALRDELRRAGYEVRTGPALPADIRKGILARVTELSANQEGKGLILATSTEMGLLAEIWKDGRLLKTLTVKVRNQDDGLDRTGEPVAASLRKALQSAMAQLMPGIIDVF
jgi:hypothetical protein